MGLKFGLKSHFFNKKLENGYWAIHLVLYGHCCETMCKSSIWLNLFHLGVCWVPKLWILREKSKNSDKVTQIRASQIRPSQIRATEISSNHHELHVAIFLQVEFALSSHPNQHARTHARTHTHTESGSWSSPGQQRLPASLIKNIGQTHTKAKITFWTEKGWSSSHEPQPSTESKQERTLLSSETKLLRPENFQRRPDPPL